MWRRHGKQSKACILQIFTFPKEPPAAACIDALFGQIKYAKSIDHFKMCLFPSNQVPMFDLRQLVDSNQSLQNFVIGSRDILTPGQVDVLRGAIAAKQLKYLCIDECKCANDGSLERILSACNTVEHMSVTCEFNSHCSALSTLLQDPTNILEKLDITERINVNGLEEHEILRGVTSGLTNNTKLRRLWLYRQRGKMSDLSNGYFHKLLCDPTSIGSICNSNHTLEDVDALHSKPLRDLLELNSNVDKAQVVRNKILKYYCVGDFDMTPFENMSVSVVPEVISRIKSDTKPSAIIRLLKCIPELTNSSNRCLTSEQSSKMKRQQI